MGMGGEYSMGDSPPEPEFVNLSRSPGIDSHAGGPVRQPYLTHRPDRLAESIPGLLQCLQIRALCYQRGHPVFPLLFSEGADKKISGSRPQIAWIGSLMGLVYHYNHFPPYRGQYTTHRNSTNIYI